MKKTAGRGYLVRFFAEKTDTAYFYIDRIPLYRRNDHWSKNLIEAKVFLTHKEAEDAIVASKKTVPKLHGKGYMYITKAFYKEAERYNSGHRKRLMPRKLTKIDGNDFLHAI